jgi:hypothetical protein
MVRRYTITIPLAKNLSKWIPTSRDLLIIHFKLQDELEAVDGVTVLGSGQMIGGDEFLDVDVALEKGVLKRTLTDFMSNFAAKNVLLEYTVKSF